HTNTMQPPRDLVGALIEFTAGMEVGHDDLGSRYSLFIVDTDRDTAAVVGDSARTIGVQCHGDGVAETGKGFVDSIVDDLINHVMQAGTISGVADVHPRPFAHCGEPAQPLDGLLVVGCIMTIGSACPVTASTVFAEVARLYGIGRHVVTVQISSGQTGV